MVAFGTMKELREQFGSLTVHDLLLHCGSRKNCSGHSRTYRQEEGFFICEAEDMKELNEISASIKEAGGNVEKIESRYPSLEEMLVKIGK